MELIDRLFQFENPADQKEFLSVHQDELDPAILSRRLKDQADRFLRVDIQKALQTADTLVSFGKAVNFPRAIALGLLAEANARQIGLGEYEQAITLYNAATQIYKDVEAPIDQATAQIGKIGALLNLGRYDEAIETGTWAHRILEANQEKLPLARLTSNLAVVYYRLGDDTRALMMFDQAQVLYIEVEEGEGPYWLTAELNRAIVLRNLGRFDELIAASHTAHKYLLEHGHNIEAARAHQGLALTYFVLGKYNETLALLDQVREVFLSDDRKRDAILTELFISDCLLELRRFEDVLEKCKQVRVGFTELGTVFEVTLAILNEAIAYTGLNQYEYALKSLSEARRSFVEQGSSNWATYCDLEAADAYLKLGNYSEAIAKAEACIKPFAGQPFKQAQARLIAAQALYEQGDFSQANDLLSAVLAVSKKSDIPSLSYLCHQFRGKIAEAEDLFETAAAAYDEAIYDLERLQGRLMVEFRSDFLADKQILYEDMVTVQLNLDHPREALEYAERAKSRALQDLLAHRLDLSIRVREPRDQTLVAEIEALRAERDRLYRRWESNSQEEMAQRGWSPDNDSRHEVQAEVLAIEKKITDLWHQLLIRNADYARDAALWQIRTEPFQEYLENGTLLLEYFAARGSIVLFTITKDAISARPLHCSLEEIEKLIGLLKLNFQVVPRSPADRYPQLTKNANGLLSRLHHKLLGPVADLLPNFKKLIIVPHGPLHYLPFHALFNQGTYLLESHEISYLPGANFLRYVQSNPTPEEDTLFIGHTYGGLLPNTLDETRNIAALWGTQSISEENASLDLIKEVGPRCKVIYLATHGDFRPDNPLFSGLALADGWLTTLDIFNLKLHASLVTLSACDTGQSVIGGGDELLGLMRAFLSAGAASMILSLWAVEDRSTAILMENFYRGLIRDQTKGKALQNAQRFFINKPDSVSKEASPDYTHPYFWAPFMLVGDPGAF